MPRIIAASSGASSERATRSETTPIPIPTFRIEVQIHSVDAFQLEDDIFTLEFRDVFWQSHGGVWLGICYPPSLENTSRFDGPIRHSSRDAALLLQPDTTLSQRPKESQE